MPRREDSLKVNVHLFQSVIGTMNELLALQEPSGRLVYLSPSTSHLFGFAPEELLGKPVVDLIHPEDYPLFQSAYAEQSPKARPLAVRCKMRDGAYRRCRADVGSVCDADGRSFPFFRLRDLDEDKEIGGLRSEKNESIGRLAGGVAHEFNNLFTVITGYTHVLLDACGTDDPDYEPLCHIQRAADRAAELVRQLLAVAGRQMLRPQVVNVNTVVVELTEVLRRLLGSAIHLRLNLDPALPSIKVDPATIGQVLLDLAANARDAMPEGGQFTLTTKRATVESLPADMMPGPAIQLTAEDTGCGMDERIMEHLFEPFFTTKEVGRGTGLSLAAAYGSIRQCGGCLTVSSRPGRGTTFTLTLPFVAPQQK